MNLSADSMKDAGLHLASGFANELRHQLYNQRARANLERVESQQGATDRALVNRCNDYAQDVLGSRKFAPWLHVSNRPETRSVGKGWVVRVDTGGGHVIK